MTSEGLVKNMTDFELVEYVVRDIMGWEPIEWSGNSLYVKKPEAEMYLFEVFTNINDLSMVMKKFNKCYIEYGKDEYFCMIDEYIDKAVVSNTLSRAVLEAALIVWCEK